MYVCMYVFLFLQSRLRLSSGSTDKFNIWSALHKRNIQLIFPLVRLQLDAWFDIGVLLLPWSWPEVPCLQGQFLLVLSRHLHGLVQVLYIQHVDYWVCLSSWLSNGFLFCDLLATTLGHHPGSPSLGHLPWATFPVPGHHSGPPPWANLYLGHVTNQILIEYG